jgi:AmpD protein
MKESKFNGWFSELLPDCKICQSQHFNSRPSTLDSDDQISLLIIHNISLPPEQFGGDDIEQFFQGRLDFDKHPYYQKIKEIKVSSHFLIKRTGELLQFVNTNERAWHAGKSFFLGRDECNDFSIGIELEGSDNQAYCDEQYQALAQLSKNIMQQYPQITPQRIMGHSDVAPKRKTDPGPFD